MRRRDLRQRPTAVLPVGAVVTVEPGIYLLGWGGVRLEDDVWLGPEGPVLLSDGQHRPHHTRRIGRSRVATTADIQNGIVLDIDGQLMQVSYFQHVKPGKGSAFVRTKLRNVRTGAVLERTFPSGERIFPVDLSHRPMTYSYRDGEFYHFMDLQTFDDVMLTGTLHRRRAAEVPEGRDGVHRTAAR